KYRLQVVAYGRCDTTAGSEMTFTTGQLPADLPQYVASGSDSSGGFVVMAAGQFGLVIDNTGRVVWYRRFPSGPGLNFQAQPVFGGRYVARPPTAATQQGVVVELDPLGAETRRITCAEGLQPRFHDMIAQPDGSYWLLCDQTETVNLANIGGNEAAQVTGTAIQHVNAKGDLLFSWSPFGYFSILDLDASDRNGSSVNWTHGNAFDIDTDGNLIASFRSLNEITKIDSRTGDVLWRMGGKANEFTFEGNASAPFARQHGVRVVGRGEIVLLDNLGVPSESRAERYVYDEAQRWARLEASYSSQPAIVAQLGGTTQDLPGGRTLVAFGNGGRVEEYDASGNVVWRIEGNPGYVYRAQRIRSLYSPGVGSRR
ncbi:MAG TPA: arylsulfotransferase family protein, partial [Gemmatimonadaceae bacterium]|nr:arylsulfotransferase family protein [Gemmatimonadaceae bacterium]